MKNFHLIDICPPDYFLGYYLPVIAIPYSGMEKTRLQVMEEIEAEYYNCFDLYEEYDDFFYEAKQNFLNDSPDELYFQRDMERLAGEDDGGIYAYFILGELQTDRLGFRYVL